ncbi:MAG: hypothetical protein DLD55_03960 [candidate division SR1 bacterium]|nr:MAG: hypothetical protein DLD55_03960 [candidate division SR1 bacterium]
MTKKMLAVALMASSVLVLAGCNKTPVEPDEVPTPSMEDVVVDEEIMPAVEEVEEPVEAIPYEEAMTGEAELTVEQPVVETEVVAVE